MTQTTVEEPILLLSDVGEDAPAAAVPDSSPRPRRKRSANDQFGQKQRKAREGALQVLFEVDLVGHDVEDVRDRQFDQMLLADGFRDYAERLVDGVLVHRDALDAVIATTAPAWPIAQLPRVDLNILRLALCELLYSTEVPVGAVINEAVELAKRYGSDNLGKFVNGTLGTVAARITAGELARGSG